MRWNAGAEGGSSPLSSETDDDYDLSLSSSVPSEDSEDLYLPRPSEIVPYRFEPEVSDDEPLDSEAGSTAVTTETEVFDHRIGNTDW